MKALASLRCRAFFVFPDFELSPDFELPPDLSGGQIVSIYSVFSPILVHFKLPSAFWRLFWLKPIHIPIPSNGLNPISIERSNFITTTQNQLSIINYQLSIPPHLLISYLISGYIHLPQRPHKLTHKDHKDLPTPPSKTIHYPFFYFQLSIIQNQFQNNDH